MYKFRHMNLVSKTLSSLVMFFIGVGAMYIANIIITRFATEAITAQWATLISFMMFGGAFALFGFDQQWIVEAFILDWRHNFIYI